MEENEEDEEQHPNQGGNIVDINSNNGTLIEFDGGFNSNGNSGDFVEENYQQQQYSNDFFSETNPFSSAASGGNFQTTTTITESSQQQQQLFNDLDFFGEEETVNGVNPFSGGTGNLQEDIIFEEETVGTGGGSKGV